MPDDSRHHRIRVLPSKFSCGEVVVPAPAAQTSPAFNSTNGGPDRSAPGRAGRFASPAGSACCACVQRIRSAPASVASRPRVSASTNICFTERMRWTRRQALARVLAPLAAKDLFARGIATRNVKPAPHGKPSGLPFHSRFTDVGLTAGLTQPVIYGGVDRKDYILETVGCGCAFIDYDNDGWLGIFLLRGRVSRRFQPALQEQARWNIHRRHTARGADSTRDPVVHRLPGVGAGSGGEPPKDSSWVPASRFPKQVRQFPDGARPDATEPDQRDYPETARGRVCRHVSA